MLKLYQNSRTVFRLKDIAMLTGESDAQSLNKKMNYYVHTGRLLNPRKGIYAKRNYNPEELACSIYAPSYISFEYVLQKARIIFQYDSRITAVSYLSRDIERLLPPVPFLKNYAYICTKLGWLFSAFFF